MTLHQKAIHLVLFVIFTLAADLYGQDISTATDSSFAAYMDSAETHLEKTQYYDRLQYKYAEEFFQYFLKSPNTTIGKEALKDACLMWINIGETEKLNSALDHIAYDSDAWYDILRLVGNSNALKQNKYDEYITLLNKLEKNLTDPKSRTAALFLLSSDHLLKDNMHEVKKRYREIIKLDAAPFYVNLARTYLYELEKFSIGKQAPQFKATTIDGKQLSLENQKSKLVILYFWATSCKSCVQEIRTLRMLRDKYSQKELQIIGISLDKDELQLQAFLNKHMMDWPQIRQPKSYNDELANLYNVRVLPKTIVINRDGKIVLKNLHRKGPIKGIAKLLKSDISLTRQIFVPVKYSL
ncbi:TlpA family protein disulfide reductase [Fodinibius halophilus]|uniref:TlpA family protein disulfide reductase n=1 Tax=Fodinibius halophilus TaxID=1736908 RepID=A0A6M1SYQ4_9BACT|nr:TlpA disulfide reductase family protein [Fodinibius halophilus]NGP88466.1 TlpA family protein disulfide reductase [Fodinibius halophilus]